MEITEQLKHTFEYGLLNELKEKATPVLVKKGETVFQIGQTINVIPLVLSGVIKIIRVDDSGHELLLYYVTANESCAMTLICGMQYLPSEILGTAEKDTTILTISVAVMDEWMEKYPTWKKFVMKTIHDRFNELLLSIDQLTFHKLDERLVHYLKEKSKATGSSLINLSHEQIAGELATSRVVVSRLLKKLEHDKKVLLYRNQIKLLREL